MIRVLQLLVGFLMTAGGGWFLWLRRNTPGGFFNVEETETLWLVVVGLILALLGLVLFLMGLSPRAKVEQINWRYPDEAPDSNVEKPEFIAKSTTPRQETRSPNRPAWLQEAADNLSSPKGTPPEEVTDSNAGQNDDESNFVRSGVGGASALATAGIAAGLGAIANKKSDTSEPDKTTNDGTPEDRPRFGISENDGLPVFDEDEDQIEIPTAFESGLSEKDIDAIAEEASQVMDDPDTDDAFEKQLGALTHSDEIGPAETTPTLEVVEAPAKEANAADDDSQSVASEADSLLEEVGFASPEIDDLPDITDETPESNEPPSHEEPAEPEEDLLSSDDLVGLELPEIDSLEASPSDETQADSELPTDNPEITEADVEEIRAEVEETLPSLDAAEDTLPEATELDALQALDDSLPNDEPDNLTIESLNTDQDETELAEATSEDSLELADIDLTELNLETAQPDKVEPDSTHETDTLLDSETLDDVSAEDLDLPDIDELAPAMLGEDDASSSEEVDKADETASEEADEELSSSNNVEADELDLTEVQDDLPELDTVLTEEELADDLSDIEMPVLSETDDVETTEIETDPVDEIRDNGTSNEDISPEEPHPQADDLPSADLIEDLPSFDEELDELPETVLSEESDTSTKSDMDESDDVLSSAADDLPDFEPLETPELDETKLASPEENTATLSTPDTSSDEPQAELETEVDLDELEALEDQAELDSDLPDFGELDSLEIPDLDLSDAEEAPLSDAPISADQSEFEIDTDSTTPETPEIPETETASPIGIAASGQIAASGISSLAAATMAGPDKDEMKADVAPPAPITHEPETTGATHPRLQPIRDALEAENLEEADSLLAQIRRDLVAEGDENTPELAELTALAGDHAAASGRPGGAKWLWRLALQRFSEADAAETPAARSVSERLRQFDN